MTDASRKYIFSRRATSIADLSGATIQDGNNTIAEAKAAGLYKVNCTHQIGIATATEIGLPLSRYPVRVVIAGNNRITEEVDTVVRYWKITTLTRARVPFQRKPLSTDLAIKLLYRVVPDLDELFWNIWHANFDIGRTEQVNANLADSHAALLNILVTPAPADEQVALIPGLLEAIAQQCVTNNNHFCIKITPDHYLWAIPHGVPYPSLGAKNPNSVALEEAALCIMINEKKMRERYAGVAVGAITTAAYTVASMFRYGFQEAYEHLEYVTVTCTPVAGSDTQYTIATAVGPAGAVEVSGITIGTVLDIGTMKMYSNLVEFSSLVVWTSGLMHYLYNHTTGGTMTTGPLLTTLGMFNLVSKDMAPELLVNITSLFYEALHPVNKRAIANIFFPTSGVTTHGKLRGSPRYEKFSLDAFAAIRKNPYPAGSHKAYVALMALKRVLQSGLAPFLPWANELQSCVATCREVLVTGARAHIGSHYYTGEPPITQPSSIDAYLPELAQYIQNFNKGDSLALSPHLNGDQAAKSNMNWTNLLKEIKSKDVSAVGVDVVRKFLSSQGTAIFNFDPEDAATWGNAKATATTALNSIANIFN